LVAKQEEKKRTRSSRLDPIVSTTMPFRLYVFGSNGEGQLGIPAEDIVSTPTVVNSWPSEESNGEIKAVRGGDNHTLVLTESGNVWAAGDNRKGQLGHAGTTRARVENFEKLRDAVSFCAATCESSAYILYPLAFDSCPARTTLTTEGAGYWGELGLASTTNTLTATQGTIQQSLPHSVVDFSAGVWHYIAILSSGAVYGWGKSRLDQLGPTLSSLQRITTPTHIQEGVSFRPIKVICGKDFTYLASDPSDGQHAILGRDKFGIKSNMPPHIQNWRDIGATWHAIFVLFRDGTLKAWGKDNMWNLVPEGLPRIERIAVGSEHVLALTRVGKLISWGWGKHGNCGDLTTLEKEAKVENDMVSGCWNEIPIPGRIRSIGAGFCTSFVLTEIEHEVE
jgi:protein ATS1